jgi:hypothetical protein
MKFIKPNRQQKHLIHFLTHFQDRSLLPGLFPRLESAVKHECFEILPHSNQGLNHETAFRQAIRIAEQRNRELEFQEPMEWLKSSTADNV